MFLKSVFLQLARRKKALLDLRIYGSPHGNTTTAAHSMRMMANATHSWSIMVTVMPQGKDTNDIITVLTMQTARGAT